jgi:MFS family permease
MATSLHPSTRLIVIACVAVILNMTGFLTVAAVLPDLFGAFSLTESRAGWLTGSTFAAYAITVPLFTALTDRMDARPVVVFSLIVCAISGFGFGLYATDFWSALGFRILAGVGFGGMHFPGLKMLADRLPAKRTVRGSGIYVSMFSLGGAASFALSGLIIAYLPWPWVFIVSGFCSLLGAALIWLLMPPKAPPTETTAGLPDIRPILSNREAMRYVIAYFGHVWEMFSFRNWFVVFIGLNIGLPGNAEYAQWNIPILAAIASLAAWPAGLLVSELAQKFTRDRVITVTVSISLVVCIVLALCKQVPTPALIALMILYSMTAFADSTAMASGLIISVAPRLRGTALALYALCGFCGGALGPALVGWVMQAAGGRHEPEAWVLAWLTIGAGTLVVIAVVNFPRKNS